MGIVLVVAFAGRSAGRGNYGNLTTNQISRHRRQAIIVPLRPTIFDRDVLTIDIAGFF
jgi:hypothetical protein